MVCIHHQQLHLQHLGPPRHPVVAAAAVAQQPRAPLLQQQRQHPSPSQCSRVLLQHRQQAHQCIYQRVVICRQHNASAAAAAEPPGSHGEVMGKPGLLPQRVPGRT